MPDLPKTPQYSPAALLLSRSKKNIGSPVYAPELNPEDYSFLAAENVFQKPELVLLMSEATAEPPINMVSFRPERALMHTVAVYVTACIKTKSEEARNSKINEVTETLKQADQVKELDKLYLEVKKEASQYLSDYERDPLSNIPSQYRERIKRIVEKVHSYLESNPLASAEYEHDMKSEKGLVLEILIKEIYNERINNKLDEIVEAHLLQHEPEEARKQAADGKDAFNNPIESLANEEPKKVCALSIAGGQASGKGTSVGMLLTKAKNDLGIDPSDFVVINTDSYKTLCIDPSSYKNSEEGLKKKKVFSQLAHPEAGIIRGKALQLTKDRKLHLLMDQVFLGKDILDYAAQSDGIALSVVVSTDVATALDRAELRGRKEGRYEDTKGILNLHKRTTEQVFINLESQVGIDSHVMFVDNNVKLGESPIPFMIFDGPGKTLTIHDEEKLKTYFLKTCINPEALKLNDLYDPKDRVERSKLLDSKINDFKQAMEDKGVILKSEPLTSQSKIRPAGHS